MSRPRRLTWRALLSALAGGGLTAATLGGPLTGGALGAGVVTLGSTAPSSTSSSGSGTESQEAEPSQGPPANTTSTPSPSPSPSPSRSSTGPEVANAQPSGSGASGSGASGGGAETPAVVLEHRQKSTVIAHSESSSLTAATSKPSSSKKGAGQTSKAPSGPNNVALPPQLVAGQAGAIEAQLAFSAASAQALAFYRIPLFLLPIYQAAAAQYGVPWQILAAINEIETDYGTDQSVSTAGAVGWMQFMPATWLSYGVDALNAGYADPYNPVDAIFAAARYLRAAGAQTNLRGAILAYNHSEEYVNSVLLRAKLISAYPASVVATLTGLVDDHLPVSGKDVLSGPLLSAALSPPSSATANAVSLAPAAGGGSAGVATTSPAGAPQAGTGEAKTHTPSSAPGTSTPPSPAAAGAVATGNGAAAPAGGQLVELLSAPNAAVVAVQDGQIVKLGRSRSLGKYVVLRDVYGDVFTYAGLGSIAPSYSPVKMHAPVNGPLANGSSPLAGATGSTQPKPSPSQPASAGSQPPLTLQVKAPALKLPPSATTGQSQAPLAETVPAGMENVRLFAHPGNPDAVAAVAASRHRAAAQSLAGGRLPLRRGSVVAEGTVLGHVSVPPGATDGHLRFAIRPAGDPGTIDPRTIVANWDKLQEALHPQGAKAEPHLLGATVGEVLLMSKSRLEREVLTDPGIVMSACSRNEVASGVIDMRALAVLAFLSRSGLKPTVGTLHCGQGAFDLAGYVPAAHSGDALAITQINGIPIAGHQGAGSITDTTIRTLLTLPAKFIPRQIVSLMQYPGVQRTLARPDHADYVEVVYSPAPSKPATGRAAAGASKAAHSAGAGPTAPSPLAVSSELSVAQWNMLIGRIAALPVPNVSAKPSSSAIPDPKAP